MNLENSTPNEVRHKRTTTASFHLHEVSRTGRYKESERRLEVTKCWRTGGWGVTI